MFDLREIQPYKLRPLHRREYDRLVQEGVFDNERVELIDGMLLTMSPQGTRHSHVIRTLTRILVPALAGRALVQVQQPLAQGDDSEPEPDISIVSEAPYLDDHPSQAFLVVEVADSSLRADRLLKTRLYARNGVPEYWIVNVAGRVIEVHRQPAGEAYRQVTQHAPGDTIAPEAFPDITITVADLIP